MTPHEVGNRKDRILYHLIRIYVIFLVRLGTCDELRNLNVCTT